MHLFKKKNDIHTLIKKIPVVIINKYSCFPLFEDDLFISEFRMAMETN